MKWSQAYIPTLRDVPQDAEIPSHQLMLRAGLIQKLASGLYSFLPLGLRVLHKVENIIREELNQRGAQELLMPILQPRQIWEKSGRWDVVGDLAMKTQSREEKEFILGPTHEEIVTDLVSKSLKSYKNLPINLYQIQVKFRDEIRPRFGVMRAKEFVMKDGYSFDASEEGADKNFDLMHDAYNAIFTRCGLNYKSIEADTGVMGGSKSQEFTALADAGEDGVVECDGCGYAANLELAIRKPQELNGNSSDSTELKKVPTPGKKKVKDVTAFFKTEATSLIKTLIYEVDTKPVAVLVRGDQELSEVKLRRVLDATDVVLASEETIQKVTGAPVGFAGPVGLDSIPLVADLSIQGMTGAITGGNAPDSHYQGVDLERDCKIKQYEDLSTVVENDLCVHCGKALKIRRGIEVGHVFKLGTKYSKSLGALFLDEKGKENPAIMGCYGIGVSRTVAAIIEQNFDEGGIVWPMAVAPFQVVITIVNIKNKSQLQAGEKLYKELTDAGYDVLLDDRNERPGPKFKDADLIGIPVRVTIGKHIEEGNVELKKRSESDFSLIPIKDVLKSLV